MLDGLTLDKLRVFVMVADRGSFRAASRALGRAQSGLSSAMANLEAELRVSLFDRTQHRPVLTEAGKTLLADARSLLIRADAIRARANSYTRGIEPELVIGLDPLIPLPVVAQVLKEFDVSFPMVRLRILATPMTSAVAMVLDGSADLALTTSDEKDPHVLLDALGRFPGLVAVCHPDHSLAVVPEETTWTTVDLVDQLQIVVSDPSARSEGVDFGVLSQRTCRVADLATKHTLILSGMGWGNLPFWMVRGDIEAGRLVRVQMAGSHETVIDMLTVSAVRRIDSPFGPAARSLHERLRQALRPGSTFRRGIRATI